MYNFMHNKEIMFMRQHNYSSVDFKRFQHLIVKKLQG